MASIMSTEGLPSCRLKVDVLSGRGILRIKDATCDLPESINPSGLKFEGGATLNSKSPIASLMAKLDLLLASTSNWERSFLFGLIEVNLPLTLVCTLAPSSLK